MAALDLDTSKLLTLRDHAHVAFAVRVMSVSAFPLTATVVAEPSPGVMLPFDVPFPDEKLFPDVADARERELLAVVGPRDLCVGGVFFAVGFDCAKVEEVSGATLAKLTVRDPRNRAISLYLPTRELAALGAFWSEPARFSIGRLETPLQLRATVRRKDR